MNVASNKSPERIGAVGKVVRVVEALTAHSGITEISRATGLPTSTVHRIVQDLMGFGWVRTDGERGYLPGAGLLTLAARAESEAGVIAFARPILERLRDETTHTVHFALRQGDEAVYVAKIEGMRAYEMRSRVGLAIPLHSTAIGKALLAGLPEEEVRAILQRTGMPAVTTHTITNIEDMLRHLRVISRRGYSIDDEENEEHTRCIGGLVRDHRGLPIGGISLSAMAFEVDESNVQQRAPLVLNAAREVSLALGYRPPSIPTDPRRVRGAGGV
jgi:IclR family acetate operon transcriptional repressor